MHHHLIGVAANGIINMSIDEKPFVGLDIGRIGLWDCGPVGPRVPSFPVRVTVRTGMPAGVKSKAEGLLMVTVHNQNIVPFGAGLISLVQSGIASHWQSSL